MRSFDYHSTVCKRHLALLMCSDYKWLKTGLKQKNDRVLVPLAKRGSTVWTSSLTQGQAEENSQRKEEYGTHDSQTGEIILQHTDPACRTSAHHHHRRLDDGVGAGVGWLSCYSSRMTRHCWITRWWCWKTLIGRRSWWRLKARRWWRLKARRGWSGRGDRAVLIRSRDRVIRWRSVLKKRFVIHVRSQASWSLHQTDIKSSSALFTRTEFRHKPKQRWDESSALSPCDNFSSRSKRQQELFTRLKMRRRHLFLISLVYKREICIS